MAHTAMALRPLWKFTHASMTHVRNMLRFARRPSLLTKIAGKAAFSTTAAWSLPVLVRCAEDDSDDTSLNKLSSLLKRFETEMGLCSGDDSIWLEMIAIREETNRLKADVLSLESRMQSVSGLMEAMAQTAFANGAEYAGICANERLLSAERQIRLAAQKTAMLEDILNRAHRDAVISGADKTDKAEERRPQNDVAAVDVGA
ncbi:uncharacterized protein LOC119167243 isoform X2 [Rhipicephalus microplus]|uniref:uncharacterized protein LOC119167243 isoform X2 n=1 Tax=Rhipicephalus microplus TaxID=6941 RepID=UPI003F6D082F